jgi:hypothetical protein
MFAHVRRRPGAKQPGAKAIGWVLMLKNRESLVEVVSWFDF